MTKPKKNYKRRWHLRDSNADKFELVSQRDDGSESTETWVWTGTLGIDKGRIAGDVRNAYSYERVLAILRDKAKKLPESPQQAKWTRPRNSRVCAHCGTSDPSAGATKCPNCERLYDGSDTQDESASPLGGFSNWCSKR